MYNSSTCIWPKGFNCRNCPNRSIEPNCHVSCEGYLTMKENQETNNKKRREESSYVDYYYEAKQRAKKTRRNRQ